MFAKSTAYAVKIAPFQLQEKAGTWWFPLLTVQKTKMFPLGPLNTTLLEINKEYKVVVDNGET